MKQKQQKHFLLGNLQDNFLQNAWMLEKETTMCLPLEAGFTWWLRFFHLCI